MHLGTDSKDNLSNGLISLLIVVHALFFDSEDMFDNHLCVTYIGL